MPDDILAEDLDTITVQDLDRLRFIRVLDEENLTTKRLERLKRLVFQRDEKAQSSALNVDELNEKLRRIPPRPPSPGDSSDRSNTPGPEEAEERVRAIAYRYYNSLAEIGGRPSAPINPDPGIWDPSRTDKELHVVAHWGGERRRAYDELVRWENFRKYQQRMRESPEKFNRYIKEVCKYQQEEGIEWTVKLQLQPERQTKLDEWREYYIYEHWKHRRLDKRLGQIQQLPESKRAYGQLWGAKNELEQLNALLKWIEGQFPIIDAECAVPSEADRDHQNQIVLPKIKPPSTEAASQPQIGKSTRRKGKNFTAEPVLGPVHSSKVSKVARGKRRSFDQERSTTRRGVLSPGSHAKDRGQVVVQPSPKVVIRRSKRISKRESDPVTSSFGPVHSYKVSKAPKRKRV